MMQESNLIAEKKKRKFNQNLWSKEATMPTGKYSILEITNVKSSAQITC